MFAIGYDIGGTKIEAALFQFSGQFSDQLLDGKAVPVALSTALGHSAKGSPQSEMFPYHTPDGQTLWASIVSRKRVPTERHAGYEQIVDKLESLATEVCRTAGVGLDQLSGIGMAIPGAVDPVTLRMVNGNTLVLKDQDLVTDLKNKLRLPNLRIVAENDANCFALAEALCGAGADYALQHKVSVHEVISVGVILGTGCGGGVVINGKTLKGSRGGAGEIGHTTLHANGLACWCGNLGCAEQYLSGSGIEQQFNARRYSQIAEFQNARSIFAHAQNSDPIALAVVKKYRADLAKFLAGLCAIFDPHFFVLGGGVSLQEAIYFDLEDNIARLAFMPHTKVPVFRNKLGDSAGVVGAALLAI